MKNRANRQKNKMVDLNLSISIITLNVKLLGKLKEIMRFQKNMKNQPYAVCKKNI